jgi:hypothetical protein
MNITLRLVAAAIAILGGQMNFDLDATVHHFLLMRDGGAIQVEVKNPSDESNRLAVRTHLRHIAAAFANGDFDAPMLTHGETPAGVPVLQRLESSVTYTFSETPNGGRVRIVTKNREALAAVHDFLRYQIREHRTHDPLRVQ